MLHDLTAAFNSVQKFPYPLIGQFLSDYVGILIPEKEYGALDHILVPKIKV